MFWNASLVGLLIRGRPGTRTVLGAAKSLRSLELEPLFENVKGTPGPGLVGDEEWLVARRPPDAKSPWDAAHDMLGPIVESLQAVEPDVLYVEPNLEQTFRAFEDPQGQHLGFRGGNGVPDPQDETLPMGPSFGWHLGADYAQLLAARDEANGGAGVRIAHLDTGFDPKHRTRPAQLQEDYAWDFVADRPGAVDPGEEGLLRNPGHGTGTLSILAGAPPVADGPPMGGAPAAEIIPFRIASSVVLFRTSALAKAIDRALGPSSSRRDRLPPVDVLSLSMGGLASAAWARAVNAAYDAGVCIVAAAGNNISVGIGAFPTRFIVYPARFHRVIAACGVMANRAPYSGLSIGRMQGNYGPRSKMATAISAFTPNISWAELGAPDVIDMNGTGTSSATPQVAAAAALWIARHRGELSELEPWARVEAVRQALFRSASTAVGDDPDKLGRGILQSREALSIGVTPGLTPAPTDSAELAVFKVLFGLGVREASARESMLAVEAAQLLQRPRHSGTPNEFETLIPEPDLPGQNLPNRVVRALAEALREHRKASQAMQKHLGQVLDRTVPPGHRGPPSRGGRGPGARGPGGSPPGPAAQPPPKLPPPSTRPPAERRLRGYAYDPSLQLTLETRPIAEVTFHVPWEPLEPGPRGEYLEVIDYDPASQAFYDPVRLDDPNLLAQDGLSPSAGNPQFHQQMVYAVASLTIRHFERALGRPALWAPGPAAGRSRPAGRFGLRPAAAHLSARAPRGERVLQPGAQGSALRILPRRRASIRVSTSPAGSCSPASRTTSSRTRPRTRSSTACTAASATPTNADRARLPRGVRRHRGAVPALHVPGGPPAPDRQDPRRRSGRSRASSRG